MGGVEGFSTKREARVEKHQKIPFKKEGWGSLYATKTKTSFQRDMLKYTAGEIYSLSPSRIAQEIFYLVDRTGRNSSNCRM